MRVNVSKTFSPGVSNYLVVLVLTKRYFLKLISFPDFNPKSKMIYKLLGIQGAKGTPLPRLCFAQLTLPLSKLPQKATIFAVKSVTYTQTHERTPTIVCLCLCNKNKFPMHKIVLNEC